MNTAAFESWLNATGRRWYHLTPSEQLAALREYRQMQRGQA